MGLGKNINRYKVLFTQGSDLLVLRLRILMMDLGAQAGSAVRAFAAIVFAAVLLLIALMSLLFGLNHSLSEDIKGTVFFSIAGGGVLLVLCLLLWALATWKSRAGQIAQTLQDMQNDLAYLRGQAKSEQMNDENTARENETMKHKEVDVNE